jgi:O-antigen ligase
MTPTGADAPVDRVTGDAHHEPQASFLVKAALFLTFAGIVVLRPALPRNTAFVDPLIALMCFLGIVQMIYRGSPATTAFGKCMPWLWLILLGSLIGLYGVGFALWGTTDLVVTYMAFLSFFTYWHIMYTTHTERYAIYGTVIGMIVVDFALMTGGGQYRQQAYFAQPNYPGHYMIMATTIMLFWTKNAWLKALAILAFAISVYETGSFGSLAFAGVLLLVWAWRSMTKNSAILVVALIAILLGAVFYATGAEQAVTKNGFNVSSSLNSTRFDRSSSSRYDLWAQGWKAWVEHPAGVGPNGVVSRKLAIGYGINLPVHNDLLSYLVERGPIGLIGLIGLWVAIWRRGRPRGIARMLILGIVIASLFRQTMHYRHMWLFLALAFVMDSRRAEQDELAAAKAEALGVA